MPAARAAALVLTGVWLGLLVASWVAATASFKAADRVLGPGMRPELRDRLQGVPAEERRPALRHLASEINRSLFALLGPAQLVLGLALVAAAWPMGGGARLLAAAPLVVALMQAVGLAPAIQDVGRSIDFLPRPLPAEVGGRFGRLHLAFVVLDLLKAVFLLAVGQLLARRPL